MAKNQGLDTAKTQVTKSITGGCHCGAIKFHATVDINSTILVCNCSVCSMTGFHHLIVPHDQFKLLTEVQSLTSYRFNSKQANHLFCSRCGVKSFYQPRSHPDCWSINAHCIKGYVATEWKHELFDGKNWTQAHNNLQSS
ncbi:GFA family protein [Marinicella litoralis]|uniref:CENP-V/GFA domain-containing protein n=1 Tax=Marinicella litoralis TaxID=644220 RepID=A0A4R6XWE8_9GAMM|nr:GFA family protein [Marinicella litoralis]TDR22467.1 hypothetical protein C8D91_0958 [Marinicella litoralis]